MRLSLGVVISFSRASDQLQDPTLTEPFKRRKVVCSVFAVPLEELDSRKCILVKRQNVEAADLHNRSEREVQKISQVRSATTSCLSGNRLIILGNLCNENT